MDLSKINTKILHEKTSFENTWYHDSDLNLFLEKLSDISDSSLIGFLGPYGCGKSTFLNDVVKLDESRKTGNIRIHFDAWQYPDRRELWDGFVLKMSEGLIPAFYPQIRSKIVTGKSKNENFISKLVNAIQAIPVDGMSLLGKSLESLLVHNSGPISRLFQYEELLSGLLIEHDQSKGEEWSGGGRNIYVVVEDVDRSGQEGLYFLETIKNFLDRHYGKLSECSLYNKLIVICPIAEESRNRDIDRYLKICAQYEHFIYGKQCDISLFVKQAFNFDEQIQKAFVDLLKQKKIDFKHNYRRLKFVIRHVLKEYACRCREVTYDVDIVFFLFLNIASAHFVQDKETGFLSLKFTAPAFVTDSIMQKGLMRLLDYKKVQGRHDPFREDMTGYYDFKIKECDYKDFSLVSQSKENNLRTPKHYLIANDEDTHRRRGVSGIHL